MAVRNRGVLRQSVIRGFPLTRGIMSLVKDATRILNAIEQGDPRASEQLLPLVYEELRRLASQRLSHEAAGHSLQATALVHEAYLRLIGPEGANAGNWNGMGHFFGAAAEAMRRILIDHARAKRTQKRGGPRARLSLDAIDLTLDAIPDEIIELDEALNRFAAEEPVKARLVNLCFFGGLSLKDAARLLDIPASTASRHWAFARAWLYDAMAQGRAGQEA